MSERERYEVADASALPFDDGAFDLVALNNMIPFFDELVRVIAPGGHVAIAYSMGDRTPIYVPLPRVRSELERRGLEVCLEQSTGPGLPACPAPGNGVRSARDARDASPVRTPFVRLHSPGTPGRGSSVGRAHG